MSQEGGGPEPQRRGGRSGPRKLAEWVSLGISVVLILGLAGFLLVESAQPHSPYIAVQVQPRGERVEEHAGQFILPLEIRNPGRRTLRSLRVEVTYRGENGQPETREVELDFLGEGSRAEVYLSFDRDPRELELKAAPVSYRTE